MSDIRRLVVRLVSLLAVGWWLAACTKERIVVQPGPAPAASWMATSRLFGTDGIVVNMSRNASSLLLQTPFALNIVTPNPGPRASYVQSVASGLPTDVFQQVPLSRDFIVNPLRDTLLQFVPPLETVTSGVSTYLNLRQLDLRARSYTASGWPSALPFGAINRNNYFLFPYEVRPRNNDLHFVLARVSRPATGPLTVQSQLLRLPMPPNTLNIYVRWIQAVDDYFLVNCGAGGLFKIRQDGAFRQVFGPSVTDACYKQQGTVYLVEQYNSMLFSTDDGETWQRGTGTPDLFNFTTYRIVNDSLVGITHSLGSQLFTLRWSGTRFRLRLLKNDGLGPGDVRGIEQLGDTVYIGSTSGLFKRPLNKFFESK